MPRLLLPLLFSTLVGCSPPSAEQDRIRVESALGGEDTAGYERAFEPRPFEFPNDHGPHPGFRNEWWYVTGNLETPSGSRFGFQVTFFRIALTSSPAPRTSRWAADQVWMGHAALTDVSAGKHSAEERFARGALGLAGAQAEPFRVWIEDWRMESETDGFPWLVEVNAGSFALSLHLQPHKPPVLQGDAGLSRKSATPGNASYYYSLTRLETRGEIRLDGRTLPVQGLSWLDREWSTSALDAHQVGWDWLSLQFDDGRDLMYYRIRDRDQEADPYSSGSLVAADGSVRALGPGDLRLAPTAWWTSPGGHRYPVAWSLRLEPTGERLRVEPVVEDQEMDLSARYWEGAVNAVDMVTDRQVGRGYLELAGY